MRIAPVATAIAVVATVFVIIVPHWSGPTTGTQIGFRGQGQAQFESKEKMVAALNALPPANTYGVNPAALQDTRPATAVYPGLTQAGGMDAGEFMRLQVSITNWIAPAQGCAFCHAGKDFGAETPRKKTAATMIRMTQTLNTEWRQHVGEVGVTCYTCHRGQAVPPLTWFPTASATPKPMMARQEPWHEAATTVRDFFPDNAFAEYLVQDTPGKSVAYTALPIDKPASPEQVARIYEVMMQMSDGMGVNCGFCHASRAFHDWGQSTPQRWTGLSGIHMTRAINNDVLLPLAASMPQTRERLGAGRPPTTPLAESGVLNGNGLATCATCHNGAPKPLPGQDLLRAAPALARAP